MTIWTSALLLCLVLVLLWAVLISVTRLQRLHRLHRRTDAARNGLERALQRRVEVALAVAGTLPEPAAAPLIDAVQGCRASGPPGIDIPQRHGPQRHGPQRHGPERGGPQRDRPQRDRPQRDTAENRLGRLLAGVDRARLPTPVRAELAEAEQALMVARSVHNDAVRDTLGLRSRRLVRWLRLAGTAPSPAYFEIADAAPDAALLLGRRRSA